MKTREIVFTKKDTAELLPAETGELGAKDVLVRLVYSTISSGTERANLTGEVNVSIYSVDKEAHFPRRLGYCSSGVVVEVGSDVRSVVPGDRVALSWGTHSQYKILNEKEVHKIESDNVDFQDAALALIATFPLGAIRKCSLEIGEAALVMGQGILGQIAVKLLRIRRMQSPPVVMLSAHNEETDRIIALEIGADYALDPFDPDFVKKAKELTHGGVKVAIEVTGLGQGLDQVLDVMAPMGRVALLGCTRHSDFTIDYYHKVHGPGIQLFGAHTQARPKVESYPGHWTHHDDIMAVLRLIELGRFDLKSLVEEVHSPEEAGEVYHRLATEKSFPVVQFDWRRLK
mgnify:CR=1 FL=1